MPAFSSVVLLFGTMSRRIDALSWRHLPGEIFLSFDPTFEIAATILEARVEFTSEKGRIDFSSSEGLFVDGTMIRGCSQCVRSALSPLRYATNGDDGTVSIRVDSIDALTGESVYRKSVDVPVRDLTEHSVRRIEDVPESVDDTLVVLEAPDSFTMPPRDRRTSLSAIFSASPPSVKSSMLVVGIDIETTRGMLQANLHKMPTAHLLDGTSPTGRLRFVSSAKDLNALLGAITYDTEQAFNDTLTLLLNNTDHSTVEKVVQILGTRNDDGRDVVDEETAELVAKMQYMETTEDVPLSLSGALKIYGKGSGIENSSNRHDLVLSIVGGDGKIRDRTSQAAESTLVFLQKSVIALGRVLDFLEYHPAKDASGLEYLVASLDDAEEVKIGLLTTPTNDPILIDAPTEINATKSLTSNILPPVYITDVDAPEMAFDVTLSTKFGHLTIAPKSAADGIAMLNSTSNTLVMRGSLRRINKALAALHYTTARNSSRDDNLRILVRENLRTNDTTIFVIVRQSNEPTQPRTLNVVSYRSHHCIEDRRCSLTGISVEIEDPAFEALLVTTTLDVYHGKLILPDKFGRDANFIRIDGALSKQVTFRTTLLECRAALQNLVYEPDSNWHGPDKLCITTSFQGTNTNSTSCINIFVENEVDPPVLNVSSLTMSLDEDDDDTSIELSRIVSVVDPDDIGVFVTTDELFRIDLSARFGRLVTDYISTSGVSTTWNGVSLERETSIGMVGSVDRINRALQSTFYESSVPARREDIIDFNLYRVSLDLHQSLLRLGCNTTARSIITNPNPSNSAPTVTAVDGNYEAWLHVQNTTRVLYLPAVTILDAEAVEFGQVLDVTISSRHGEFRIRSRGRLANVSTQRSSLTFQAFPEDATIAIPNVAYVPFTHFCGFDFVDIIVSDRGADGDGRGSPKTSKLRLNIRVDDVNHQPHIEVPATQTAFGKQAAVSLQGIVLSDVDETLEGTCGNANLQLSISADEGTIQISDFSSAILNPSHAGRLFEAKGTPSALTKLLRTLTLQDLSIGDHRVNVTLQDGSGAIDFKSFPVRVHRLPPISASVQIAQDIPVLLNEDEKLPLKSLLSVHSELPFDFAVTAAPGKLFFQTNASRVELGELSLSGTQTEIIAMLDSIEYVPPKNFNGIARLDASTRESTATLFVQILPLNDPPEIDSISLASGMVQGDVVYLMNAIQLRDSDADDILFANLSVSSGALIADMKSPGVKFTFDSSWVEIVGADDSVSKALSTLTYDATMTGFGTLTIIVRDRMGSNVSETLEYYVEEPSMSAVLSMRAGHLDGFAEVDEDSIFNSLGTFLEVKQVCISKAMLSLRLQTTHGNVSLVPSVWTALDCATSFEEMRCSQIANFSVWSDELGRSILIVHGTADAISRALEEKLAYVPPPDFTGVDTIIATLTSVRSPTECMSEAVRIYVKPVADKPILTFNNSFSIKYEDRPVRLDISVQDSDEEDLLNFLAYARYGNLAYGSRRARKKSVRYYDKVETRIFSNCWTPPSIAGHLEAFSFVQFASTAEEISSISAELNYFPHPEHNFDRISTFVVDSFQLCSNRTADVKVYADQAMLSVTTVSHHDGALLSILEDAPRTKVPALKIIAEGMVASTPSIVNVTVESKFGDISLNSDMNMSQVRIWSRNQTSIGFVARLVDANLALKQFFYKPRLHFFGRWEAYDESSLLDEYDTRKSTEFDVRNACRKRELDRKPLRESISVHVAPITKRGVTDDSSWASSQWRVSVSPVNDAPIIMFDTHALDLPRASARSWHRVAAMANVSLHDSDAGFLEMTVMTLHGDIKLIRPKQIKILENSAKRLTIRGSVNALNVILDNALFYAVPEANTLDAEDTLHFKVQDLGGCGLGPKYERDFELSLKVSSPLISLESKIATERIKVAEDELLALPPVLLSVRGQRYFSDTASVHMESTTSLSFEENVSLTSYARRDREENSNSAFVRDVVQLQGSATHANLAIPEDIPGIEILEPAKMLKLSVLTINENASDYGQDEVWSISTHVPWTRCVQRLAIFLVDDKSSLDQVSKSLSVTSFKIAMTHRNRSSAAELTIGKNRADAKKNVIDALESLSNVGAVSVSIEHFGVETPSATSQSSSATAVAVFLITFSQNDPVPPLDVLITTCGPSVGDGTLKYGEDVKSNCSATISQIQEASTVPETQRVSIRSNGTMKSGQFSIVVDDIPSSGKIRTTLLPFNATADDIRHALESLPSVGLVDVVRSRFNHPMELENDCWCEQCSNAWRVHSSLQNETSLLPNQTSPLNTNASIHQSANYSRTIGASCNFYPHETSWEITFFTLDHDLSPLDLEFDDVASQPRREICIGCVAASSAWSEHTAALAGLQPAKRAIVQTLTNGTTRLGGRYALKWGTKTTSLLSVHATSGQMQSSLSALDPSLRAPGALKVSRSGTSTEGSASWLVTFNSQLGIIPVLAPTALGELRGTGATVYSNFVAGARREEVHFALRVQNEKSLALTTPLSLTSTATEMQLAIIDAFRVAGVTESANLISVLRSPQIGKHVVWIITISEGFRKKTNLWIEKSNHLPAGLNLVLEDLDCAFRNKSVHTHVLLKSARKPPVVREQQIIRCSLHQFVTDGLEDIHFYLSFRGQKSPPISAVAAPNAKALPRCAPSEREACREDGSSLEEIINTWFLRMGVTKGDEKAVSVHSTASTVCSRYGNPVDSTITFVGDGVEGDVETFLLETGINSLANSSQIQVIETVPGSNPYIREVQHVETFRKRLNNDSSYNESDSDLRFILRFRGERTQPLQLNASAQEMESALNALSTISGNVRVFRQSQRNGTSTWSITFAASPPTQGRLPLIERVEYFGDEEAERAEEKNARSFSVDETSIVISRVVEGLAPAWGSYALRIEQCQPNESRGRSETGLLRLDSTVDEIQAALRRLPGAFQSTFSIENNLFSEWGSLYRIENLDPGATVSIVRSQISLPVDWCETNVCSRLANLDTEMFLEVSHACSACQRDRSIPEIPLRVLIVREKVDIRGTPAAIGRALARPLFLGDSNYNSRINGASRVSWSAFLRTSQEFVANHSYYVEVDSLNDPPEIFLPSIAPIFEDTPTAIGLGIVISDPDDRDTFRQYVNVTLTAEYGTLWIPSSERVQVISGYRDGGGAGPAGLLEFRGRPADLTRVISELVYEPPTNWASKALKTDIQRVTVEIPTHHVVQTVAIGVTGSGVISGNFSLTLQCGYLNDALEEVTRKHTINVSRYPHISVQNTSVKFTVAANALASGPQVSSFEKRMQDALDACATKAIRAAATGGVQFESNSSAFEALRAVVEVSVWRSPQRAVDDGYLWEITLIKAPPQFPLLEVVRHELSGDPRGLVVTSFSGNNATSETRNPADGRPWVNISYMRGGQPDFNSRWFTLQHDCAGLSGTTERLPLDVSAIELTEALNALPSIGSIRVFFDDAASQPLDNKFAWQIEFLQDGEPAHVGDETLLSGSVAEGVTVQVEKLRSGIATEDKIRLRAVDQAGEWVKSEALVVVRPVHDWPKISLAALEANFYATGMEDEAIFNLFRGISIFVDHDGRQNEMALATLEVNCAHKCTLLVTNSEFPHTWIDDSRGESSGDTSLKLQGTVHVLQELIRGCTLIPEPNFFGVEIVNLWLTDSRGFIAKRTLAASVTPVNDPPSITVSNQSLPLIVSSSKATIIPGLSIVDVDDDLINACEHGKLRIKRRLRRTLAFWQSGDDDEGSQVLDATGLTFAWNNALLQLEYIASEDSAPDALCFTVKDAHGEFQNLTIPVGFRAAASCASTLQARLHEPLNRTATSTAIHAARALDVDAGASNVTAIIEGSKISLNGLHLESHCKRNTSLRVTIIELEVEDFDGFVVGARLSYNSPFEQHSAVTVDETVPGKIVLATSAASGEVAVSQLNKAFAHIEYHPPPDFTGLSRLHVAVSDTSEKIPRGLEVDLWLAILELNESPEIVESGPTVRAVGTSPGGFLSLRAVVRSMPTTEATSSVADEATLADQARNAPRFFRENHGGVNIHDDDRTLLTISIQVVWSAKTDSEDVRKRAIAADGSRVALSLEAGCVVASCGILHFAEHLGERRGRITGAHDSLRFLASVKDANRAIAALRVVALGDYENCWRSANDIVRNEYHSREYRMAVLIIGATDSEGLSATKRYNIRVGAPMYSPFTFDGDRQVVRSFEDSIALLSGMRFRDGKAVVSGKCGQEEKIELRIRAKQGSISSPLNLSNIGISQKHQGDEIVYYGSRTALSQLFGL